MRYWLLLGMVVILAACGSPVTATPAPTPQAIKITYPTGLQKWVDNLANCAVDDPRVALYVNRSNQWNGDLSRSEVALEFALSNADYAGFYLTQLGYEQLQVVSNQENPLSELTGSQLTAIFSGQVEKWPGATGRAIQVWVLPKDDPLRTIFDQAVLHGKPASSNAMLAPDSTAMLEAISSDPDSIGYLPASWIDSGNSDLITNVKIFRLDDSLANQLHQPVIAVTHEEPVGLLRELLVCLVSNAP